MARAPARIERVGALTPRDRMWAAIRALAHVRPGVAQVQFSAVEVAAVTGIALDTVLTYVFGLVAARYLCVTLEGRPSIARPRREYSLLALVRDVGVEAPAVDKNGRPTTAGEGRRKMWDIARRWKGDFDVDEVCYLANMTPPGVTVEDGCDFFKILKKAGYVRLTRASKPGTKARYAFVKARDTGARAPVVSRDKSVMDGNTGEVVWQR